MDNNKLLDPRILRTRQLLKDALIQLLQEMDIEKITINRLAEEATINRVTFYLHYRDIPDMLDKMAAEMMEDIRSILNKTPENMNSLEEVDSSMMVNLLEHIAEHAKFYKIVLGSRKIPIFTERLLKLLTGSIAERLGKIGSDSYISKTGIPMDIAVGYYSSAMIGTIVGWLRNDMPYTPLFLTEQFSLLSPRNRNND
ncbi:TetR/AcrR family transcriptional regulator [Paenibacillus sp. UNC451MF]|uniref:TetR/AcrR family transcriptional regulator n=1 Tax=Paenibacillus sp. UNC451MF TaxID=1449063 RepID=UPI00048B6F59|nr:TetR/AcrR family transcriptional regulator [Paenibacillus sp. UNC451MF]